MEPALLVGELKKLQQIGIVAEYLERFDDLKSHVLLFNKELKKSFFISCFISGLKEEIKGSVLIAKPQSFQQAVALVKRFETPNLKTPTQRQRSFSSPPIPLYLPKPNTTSPIRKLLTIAEMKARGEKNLCYNCNETYVPRHRSKKRPFFLMMTEGEEKAYLNYVGCEEECVDEVLLDSSKVSLNAMNGLVSCESIRLRGFPEGREVKILSDSGSTHYFIDKRVAGMLNTTKEHISPLMISDD
ncbi:hypothetical protein CDL12_00163 [Handroanthus impetiginosus]|uniref:Retrotransposon gag domain-containing protein n=1 Tax=Handroanthus impetiginosus TaxID=429701 RepID=A0A2G9IBE1_9LAMI|nr:hypothetical protein CDL12_00163 [Handroanthus impetiginosus]